MTLILFTWTFSMEYSKNFTAKFRVYSNLYEYDWIMSSSCDVSGLGAGAGATLFGELARISTKQERTRVFSIFSTFRQVGLILGKYYIAWGAAVVILRMVSPAVVCYD